MLNGLTDGKQTTEDINNFEEKTIANTIPNYPKTCTTSLFKMQK